MPLNGMSYPNRSTMSSKKGPLAPTKMPCPNGDFSGDKSQEQHCPYETHSADNTVINTLTHTVVSGRGITSCLHSTTLYCQLLSIPPQVSQEISNFLFPVYHFMGRMDQPVLVEVALLVIALQAARETTRLRGGNVTNGCLDNAS